MAYTKLGPKKNKPTFHAGGRLSGGVALFDPIPNKNNQSTVHSNLYGANIVQSQRSSISKFNPFDSESHQSPSMKSSLPQNTATDLTEEVLDIKES